jgi:hypothetical protein
MEPGRWRRVAPYRRGRRCGTYGAIRRVGGDLAIQEDRGRVVRATHDNRENAGRVGGGRGGDGIAGLAVDDYLYGGRAGDSRRHLES